MLDRAQVMAAMAHGIATGDREESLARRLCSACVGIAGANGAAITLSPTTPERLTVWTSDGTSERIEELQDVLGVGPGQTAYDEGRPVVVHLGGGDGESFSAFSRSARDLALAATVWALPMRPAGETIGVLTLYSEQSSLDVDLEDAQFIADAVGAALVEDSESENSLTQAAWSDRARVHQATGMVIAQLGVTPEDAMAMLRAHAYSSSSSLDELALEVVERRLVFTSTAEGVRHPAQNNDSPKRGEA